MTLTNKTGHFTMSVRGRGLLLLRANAHPVLERQKKLDVSRGFFACVSYRGIPKGREEFAVDFESSSDPAPVDFAASLVACPIR